MVTIIRELCAEKKITLVSLEAALSFAKNSIYKWDTNKPSIDKVQKVADYFNVSTDYLLGRTPYKRPTDDPSLVWGYVTPTGRELTPEEQEEAKKFIDMMVRAHDAEKKDK